jgi:hypothetical protein
MRNQAPAASATPTDYVLEFLNRVVIGRSAHLHATATLTASAEVRGSDGQPK